MIVDVAHICPVHPLPMLVTQSKLQRVCQNLDCDYHVRLSGPLMPDKEKEDMSPKDQPLATVSNPKDKKEREGAIAAAMAKKKAQAPAPTPAPEPAKKPAAKKKADEPEKKADAKADDDMLSVSDVARELGLNPKHVRAKLRAGGQSATEGRWPKVKRGSKKHSELVAILKPAPDAGEKDDDEEDDDGDAE